MALESVEGSLEGEISTGAPFHSSTTKCNITESSEKLSTSILAEQSTSSIEPMIYSTLTKSAKRVTVALITLAAVFSPISSSIFFPAIDALASSLHTSVGKINLTITSYMIVAGVAPAVIGDMSDITGRRVVYLLTMAIYCVANVGLALQNSWTALFSLRMVQSAGSAATIAIAWGVVSDIATPSERGGFVGVVLLGPNFGVAIGPILGGALVQHPGWRWIFWCLAISSGLCLALIALFLPETSRFIVGNGSQEIGGIHRTVFAYLRQTKPVMASLETGPTPKQPETTKPKMRVPNPLKSLKILWAKDMALITLINAIYYTSFSCIQASMSTLFIRIYGLSQLQSGLVYLPFGIGSFIGAYISGKIMNRDYRITASNHDIVIDTAGGDDLTEFPIEKARFRSIFHFIGMSGVCITGYGWALQAKIHLAIPLILEFFVGLAMSVVFNTCGTLIVDLHPKSPAAAQAANNIVRCSMAGGGIALLETFLDAVGPGWTFVIFGSTLLSCLAWAWIEYSCGERWRESSYTQGIKK